MTEQLTKLEEQGISGEGIGLPTLEKYEELRDMITDYTDGKLIVTSWRWNVDAVKPGQSAGLCLSEPAPTDAYWSCWEFYMEQDGEYSDMNKSYLINPDDFFNASRLNTFTDLSIKTFPAMYGAWMCWPPVTMNQGTYTNCMRFLPSDSYSTNEDY